jgi:hypothetical protein
MRSVLVLVLEGLALDLVLVLVLEGLVLVLVLVLEGLVLVLVLVLGGSVLVNITATTTTNNNNNNNYYYFCHGCADDRPNCRHDSCFVYSGVASYGALGHVPIIAQIFFSLKLYAATVP